MCRPPLPRRSPNLGCGFLTSLLARFEFLFGEGTVLSLVLGDQPS